MSERSERQRPDGTRAVVLLGAPIDDVTLDEVVDLVGEMVADGRATGRTHQIATVNVDFLVNAVAAPDVLAVLQRADLAIPDGMPIVWGSRLVGAPVRERTAGADLVPALAERAATAGWRIHLFGAAAGVAEQAAALLRDRYPGAAVSGSPAPVVDAAGAMRDDEAAVLAALREVDADVVGVALGNPKQERWIARHRAAVGAPVYIGIGGSLDFLTGVTRRAPAWMQRAGLEWLHRALSEPRRLVKRYANDFVVFGPGLARQAWRGRRPRGTVAVEPVVTHDAVSGATTVVVGGPTPDAVIALDPEARAAITAGGPLTVDLAGLVAIDDRTLAAVAAVVRAARRAGAPVAVRGVDGALAASLARLGAAGVLADDGATATKRDPGVLDDQ